MAMKKIFMFLSFVAVAAMGVTACHNEFEETNVNNPEVIPSEVLISFVADATTTRTAVDTSSDEAPVFSWSDDETFTVLEQTDALAVSSNVTYEKVEGKANITAAFATNEGKAEYKYVTVYPESGFKSAESIDVATLQLPATQTMAEASYDPNADLMVSKPVVVDAQPTAAQQVEFTRVAAVVKMTLKNLKLEAGDEVERVIFTAEGEKRLAGSVNVNLNAPHEFTVKEGVNSVSVATTKKDDVYFTVLPTTLEAGDAYTITVVTNRRLYVKQGKIAEGKTLTLEAGMVNRFGVNMQDVAASEKWVLVRDASTLEAGDIVTIAAKNYNYVMGCNRVANYPFASYNTDIIKAGDYLYHPIITNPADDYEYMVQPLILAKQDANKAAFDFYDGIDYESVAKKTGYLTSAETNNYLQLQDYPSMNSAFEITITDGVATIEAKDSEHTNKLLKFFNYNPNYTTSSYRRFVCIDAAKIDATKHDDVCIYKLAGAKGTVPVAGAVVTVPDKDESVVIGIEGVAELTAFEEVKFNYVGDWAIEATSDAAWLTLDYADGVLRYLAGANEGTARKANVTITATHDGEETKSWTFQVVQKGAPIKVTIAEFIEKEVDAYIEYEVTGKLTKKASGLSGGNTITDINGETATFKYVEMAEGGNFYENKDIELGDIVTIVAVVSDEATGGSSAAHAICKGYYNLEAEVENGLVAYTGGSVDITLNKLGTIAPVGNISCTTDEDFADVAYTTNANKATITLSANSGAPRQAIVSFTDGYATTSVAVVQSADTTKGNTWELVTDASTLAECDQVIIAAKDYDVAMSTTIESERRNAVAVTKLGNYYIIPTPDAQTLVLANGSVDDTFAFYDGVNKGFLVSSSTSYKLNNQSYIDANTSFTITIADGVATIGNKEGTYNENKLYYREGSSYNYFYSGETEKQAICLYRLVGVKGSIPVTPADVTVPADTKNVVIPEEGAAVATPINDVVFNYVGDWTISATANADWISFDFDKASNKLTYTALANDGEVREATATITATMEGQETLSWTFNLLQKGAPEEITCDALNDKTQNVDITYKLTGRIVEISTSSSGTFMLDDGTGRQAKITYLYTDGGVKVEGNEDIGLAVGDVVTVTTTVYSKGYGGNSKYHSTYKGHYRLTATADKNLIGYEGGTATFNIATSGNMLPEGEVVKGAPAEAYDFVTFDYTDNAATATATFAANSGAARNAEFKFTYGLASVTVAVGQYNHPDVKKGWFLVTDVNELAVGDKVIIAAKSPDGTLDYGFADPTSSTTSTQKGIAIELLGNSIKDVAGLDQFTLGNGSDDCVGTWSFKDSKYGRYLGYSSSYLKLSTSIDANSSWAVTIASDGKATLVSQTSYSKNTMMFNYTASNQTFALYTATTTGKGAIYIYKYFE